MTRALPLGMSVVKTLLGNIDSMQTVIHILQIGVPTASGECGTFSATDRG